MTGQQRAGRSSHGDDRIHRARQYGIADGAEPHQGGHQVTGFDVTPAGSRNSRKAAARRRAQIGRGRRHRCRRHHAARGPACARRLSRQGGVLATRKQGAVLIDCSTIDVETARAVAGQRPRERLADGRRAGLGRRRRRARRHAHLHGRRQRRRVRESKADPRGDGQDHRACGRARERAGRENLQQHDPRHFDDRGFGSLRARRKARPRSRRSCSTSPRSRPASAGR